MDAFDDDIITPAAAAQTTTDKSTETSISATGATSEYMPSIIARRAKFYKVPHLITQSDFNDLMCDLTIPQQHSELLASRLKEWNLVTRNFRITSHRKRQHIVSFDAAFSYNDTGNMAYCNDIDGLFDLFQFPHNPDDWRLFIDGSTKSLKAVLLHIGNIYPSVPVLYAVDTKETYAVMEEILELLDYETHQWRICCDLKVVGLLTGLKKGYPKHSCFLCLWEGRVREFHYTDHVWPLRISHRLGEASIENLPLVPSEKVILPPLHIKLGLMTQFTKSLDRESLAYNHLKNIFPRLSEAKIKAGVFNGPADCHY